MRATARVVVGILAAVVLLTGVVEPAEAGFFGKMKRTFRPITKIKKIKKIRHIKKGFVGSRSRSYRPARRRVYYRRYRTVRRR